MRIQDLDINSLPSLHHRVYAAYVAHPPQYAPDIAHLMGFDVYVCECVADACECVDGPNRINRLAWQFRHIRKQQRSDEERKMLHSIRMRSFKSLDSLEALPRAFALFHSFFAVFGEVAARRDVVVDADCLFGGTGGEEKVGDGEVCEDE